LTAAAVLRYLATRSDDRATASPHTSSYHLVSSTPVFGDQVRSRRVTAAPDGAAAERQLARWIAEGDDAALGELLELLGPTLYAVALGITQDPKRAEAAIEETFAELWENRAWLGRLPALSPWLVERCRTWAIALRTGTAPPTPPIYDRAGDVPLSRRLLRCPPDVRTARVDEALSRLHEGERQAVVLAVRAGLSPAAIARLLKLAADDVPALLLQGLNRFREALDCTLRREAL
jgi:DNA-directed RNA polymerase specialized sigma24 family protein